MKVIERRVTERHPDSVQALQALKGTFKPSQMKDSS
jgi:hypothetical protein